MKVLICLVLLLPVNLLGSTIWNSSSVPAIADSGASTNLELGVKFRSDVAGTVNGIRFYKAAANTGTHVGHLWTMVGALLGSVTFTNETSSGWQQANFAVPIQIQAGMTYVASYYDPNGHFSLNRPYFTVATDNPPLHALADGANGPNGVYASPAAFPIATYAQSNYWVDIDFSAMGSGGVPTPNENLTVTGVSPVSGAAAGSTTITIKGTGFQPGAKALFGGVEGTTNTVISSTQMQSTSPPGTGAVPVTVKNLDAAPSTQIFTFTAVTPPWIGSVLPPTGPVAGGTIVAIGGFNFALGATVKFGTVPAQSVVVLSPTQITCLSPPGVLGSVPITVSNPDGQIVTMVAAFIYAAPTPPVVIPPVVSGGKGLLSGMTPANFTVPAGWTLVQAVDFEDGTAGSGTSLNAVTVQCTKAHGGRCAATHKIVKGDDTGQWNSKSFTGLDTYVSWWEFEDAGGSAQTDIGMAGIQYGSAYGGFWIDPNNPSGCNPGQYPSNIKLNRYMLIFGTGGFQTFGFASGCLPINQPDWGNWTQWEYHLRINDPHGPGPANGEYQLYQNGVLVANMPSGSGVCSSSFGPCSNMVGMAAYSNLPHSVWVGGVSTYRINYNSAHQCSTALNESDIAYQVLAGSFNNPNPCRNQAPPNGWMMNSVAGGLNRWWDDIIIMKR